MNKKIIMKKLKISQMIKMILIDYLFINFLYIDINIIIKYIIYFKYIEIKL